MKRPKPPEPVIPEYIPPGQDRRSTRAYVDVRQAPLSHIYNEGAHLVARGADDVVQGSALLVQATGQLALALLGVLADAVSADPTNLAAIFREPPAPPRRGGKGRGRR